MKDRTFDYRSVESTPLGPLEFCLRGDFLCRLGFTDPAPAAAVSTPESSLAREVRRQLRGYFTGRLQVFDLPLDLPFEGFTAKALSELSRIPFGQTVSYAELAQRAGNPRAFRAAGLACRSNPIPIVIPCHRVLGRGDRLTGFSCGLWRKAWLLRHEGVAIAA
ncbi:MAG: methylated-DNA--[protein]-cysteine S-methyltransferase [Puniceicoccaceae bacterium]|nr:MAG: methylated-DNA--[protein]-cysteine S-methyltransferase [Puniceicoccaceae bacterium]